VCSLGDDADRTSPGARQNATQAGLFEIGFGEAFDFSKVFGDRSASASGIARQCRTETLLRQRRGDVDAQSVMRILSDHSDGTDPSEPFVEDVGGPISVCLHRTDGPTGGTSAASLVADLCSDDSRLPVYWCGMYSPCMTLYMPVFLEGDLPPALSIGNEQASEDSPWWAFHNITQSGLAEGAERRREIRSAWAPLQDELTESAYEMARRGRDLIDGGWPKQASTLLSGYMHENFVRMMEAARTLERTAVAR
jgi:dipeptidase